MLNTNPHSGTSHTRPSRSSSPGPGSRSTTHFWTYPSQGSEGGYKVIYHLVQVDLRGVLYDGPCSNGLLTIAIASLILIITGLGVVCTVCTLFGILRIPRSHRQAKNTGCMNPFFKETKLQISVMGTHALGSGTSGSVREVSTGATTTTTASTT